MMVNEECGTRFGPSVYYRISSLLFYSLLKFMIHAMQPYFANSGHYYLVSSARTVALAWGVVTQFDLLQRTGSHQNIVTLRLQEGLDLAQLGIALLPSGDFPNGDAFHHDPAYMARCTHTHTS